MGKWSLLALLVAVVVVCASVLPAVGQSPRLYVEITIQGYRAHVEVVGRAFIEDPSPLDDAFYSAWAGLNAPSDIGREIWGLLAIALTGYLQYKTKNPLVFVDDLQHFMLFYDVYTNVTDVWGNTYQVRVGKVCMPILYANISNVGYNLVAFRAYNLAWKALDVAAPIRLEKYNVGVDLVPVDKVTLINASILPPLGEWKWYFNGTHTIIRYWSDEKFCTTTVGGKKACYEGIRAEIVVDGYAVLVGEDTVVVPTNVGVVALGAVGLWAAVVAVHALSSVLARVVRGLGRGHGVRSRFVRRKTG